MRYHSGPVCSGWKNLPSSHDQEMIWSRFGGCNKIRSYKNNRVICYLWKFLVEILWVIFFWLQESSMNNWPILTSMVSCDYDIHEKYVIAERWDARCLLLSSVPPHPHSGRFWQKVVTPCFLPKNLYSNLSPIESQLF